MKLNKEQKEAAETLDGPVLVTAGPGTGKTQLLSVRAANIMREKNIPGENILILTYTNAAAKSVKERLVKIVGFEGYKIFAETFHSFANSIILDSEEASDYMKGRVQMSDLERTKCLEYIIDTFMDSVRPLRPFGYPYYYIPRASKRISELKNEGITPSEFEKTLERVKADNVYIETKDLPKLKALSFIYKKYEELKGGADKNIFDERGRYDYDDMIVLALKILETEDALTAAYRKRYKYIMVDEFQDTNGAQLKLLFAISGRGNPNLCCVGDDDQSIYRFQGASIANFKILKDNFPALKIVRLKRNYRSTKEIIGLSSSIINAVPPKERLDEQKKLLPQNDYKNKNIEFAEFSTEDEEIMHVIKKINEAKNIISASGDIPIEERNKPYNHIAVMVRKRSSIVKLIDSFLKNGIPYATDGKEDISGQKRVRQVIDALKLAKLATCSPEEKDLALFRVLSSDFFGIPSADILKFIGFANSKKEERYPNLFAEFIFTFRIENLSKRLTPSDTKKLKLPEKLRLVKTHKMHFASWAIQRLMCDSETRPLHDLLLGFVQDSGLYGFIINEYGNSSIVVTRELRSLTSFINMVKDMSLSRPDLRLTEFLDELETMKIHRMPMQGRLVTATQDGVRLITAHASKGLEFHACFVPFCIQDKSWPLKPPSEKLPLPAGILKRKESAVSKTELSQLTLFDEMRLFYVATSRAKSSLYFTASPRKNNVTSSFLAAAGLAPKGNETAEEDILKEFFRKKSTAEDALQKNTAPILRDLVKNLILTPTKLNKFLRCRRQFLYDSVLLLPGRKNQSLVFGNCAHKALEDTYKKYKKEDVFPDFNFFKNTFLRELKFQGANKAIVGSCLVKLSELKGWFEKTRKTAVIPIDFEKNKKITLKGGIIFAGKYDKIEFENENKGTIRVIDYKTGKPDKHIKSLATRHELISEKCDDYFRQLVAYKMLYEKDMYEPAKHKVACGVVVFLEPVEKNSPKYNLQKGAYVDRKIALTDDMVSELEDVIFGVWKELYELRFDKLPERDYGKCRTCAFDSTCWEIT